MEYGSRLRFALITIGGIIMLVLAIWGVTSLARRMFGPASSSSTSSTVKKTDLADYNKTSSYVRLTVDGPINASEKHESYQIEVGQNYRLLTIFKGYNKEVASEHRFTNDSSAYEAFLKSLKRNNFTAKGTDFSDDQAGYCATGNRYTYELIDFSEQVLRSWNTSCSAATGNFDGAGTTIRSLFKKQIPDFSKISAAAKLSI